VRRPGALTAQLTALDNDAGRHGTDPALLDELPELATRLDELPERLQADLFAAFDIQILWNPPLKQATFFATITDTITGIVAASWPAPATTTSPPLAPARTRTRPPPAPARFRFHHVAGSAGNPRR
jgi:hypothetical protein